METPAQNIEALYSNAGEYVKNKSELFKLKLIDKSTTAVSSILDKIILIFIGAVFFVLLTIGLALLIGYWLGHSFWGFFVMAGLYGIVGFIIHSSRHKLIKTPILNSIIHHFLN
jgi:fatty acid desaturase